MTRTTADRSDLAEDSELRSLAAELTCAIGHESVPRMLRNLLRTALDELRAARADAWPPSIVIARFAVAEWRRWCSSVAR